MSIETQILEKGKLSVKSLIRYLNRLEKKIDSAEGGSVDLTEITQEINSLKTSKANANHSHTSTNISDVDTAQIVVTYQDSTTETLNVLVKTE